MKDGDLRYVLRKIGIVGKDEHVECGIVDSERYDILCSKVAALYAYFNLKYVETEKHGDAVRKEKGDK